MLILCYSLFLFFYLQIQKLTFFFYDYCTCTMSCQMSLIYVKVSRTTNHIYTFISYPSFLS